MSLCQAADPPGCVPQAQLGCSRVEAARYSSASVGWRFVRLRQRGSRPALGPALHSRCAGSPRQAASGLPYDQPTARGKPAKPRNVCGQQKRPSSCLLATAGVREHLAVDRWPTRSPPPWSSAARPSPVQKKLQELLVPRPLASFTDKPDASSTPARRGVELAGGRSPCASVHRGSPASVVPRKSPVEVNNSCRTRSVFASSRSRPRRLRVGQAWQDRRIFTYARFLHGSAVHIVVYSFSGTARPSSLATTCGNGQVSGRAPHSRQGRTGAGAARALVRWSVPFLDG